MSKRPIFWRSPRLKAQLSQQEIEIPAPPQKPSLPSSILPIVMSSGMMITAMLIIAMVGNRGSFLLFSAPMLLASGAAAYMTNRMQKNKYEQEMAKRHQGYNTLLDSYRNQLQGLQDEQQKILLEKDPKPNECLQWVVTKNRRMWARRPEDSDFLAVRLGIGSSLSKVVVKPPKSDHPLEPDPLIQAAQVLAKDFIELPRAPVVASLQQEGVAGVAGPRSSVINISRAIMMQLAANHSPDEVKIVAIYPQEEEEEWEWLRWLPHAWDDSYQRRFVAHEKDKVHRLLMNMNEILNNRKNQQSNAQSGQNVRFATTFIFLLAAPELVRNEPLIQRLQSEGPTLGAYPIFLNDRVRSLPQNCQALIKVAKDESYLTLTRNARSYRFVPDLAAKEAGNDFALAMAPVRLEKSGIIEMPTSISLLALMKAQEIEDLQIEQRWQNSQSAKASLAVPIGLDNTAEPLILDLHEKGHGPNGLVAGMVGAGKSELLQTVVACLALNFHPHRVAFVLIDYKGGGMADPFVNLPQTLGIITNLQKGTLAQRAITSLRVEAERRQHTFRDAGVNKIADYQKLYYKGEVQEPMPYLVVIVDEFAEMKSEQPEDAKEFIKIARLGRALGFCLILAMQRPAGVVDGQIEANTRFRLCLRVAQREDSRAMLKRDEAALLSGVGRAYFQVGVNEIFELFQVAYSGALYDPTGSSQDDPLAIKQVMLDGRRDSLYSSPKNASDDQEVTQLQVLVDHLIELGHKKQIQGLSQLWLPPLGEHIALEEIDRGQWNGRSWQTHDKWIEPVIGLLDDPRNKDQRPLAIDLGKEGHLSIYGAPGYGKTTVIQSLIVSLARQHSPEEVNFYLLDFGGRVLNAFAGLPHVGGVVFDDDNERLDRLFDYLMQQLEERKRVFGQSGVTSLPAYRDHTKEAMPAIVVVIDNFANFLGNNEPKQDLIIQLSREGGSFGIHLVLTANSMIDIKFKVSSNITMAVALYLVDRGEYVTLVGRSGGLYPEPVAGRGLVRDNPPLEFQTALPIAGQTEVERGRALRALIQQMSQHWHGLSAPPIPTLPDMVELGSLLQPQATWPSDLQTPLAVPIGLSVADLRPFEIDLNDGPNFLITGPAQSGKTTLLHTLLLALADRYSPEQLHLCLLDSQRRVFTPLKDLPHIQAHSWDQKAAKTVLTELQTLIKNRQQLLQSMGHGAQGIWSPLVVVAIDDCYDPFYDGISDMDKKKFLADMVRQTRDLGIHWLVSGSNTDLEAKARMDPFLKMFTQAQVAIVLGGGEDRLFNLHMRLPREERGHLLPPGQGYFVHRGRFYHTKFATPYAGQPNLEEWVAQLIQRHADSSVPVHTPSS